MTVEAAMLIPIVFFVIFSCVWFCFHLHNLATLTAGCGESAISGQEKQVSDMPFYLAEQAELTLTASENERTVTGKLSTIWFTETEETLRSAEETMKYRIVKPVKLIRKAHAVIELTEGE